MAAPPLILLLLAAATPAPDTRPIMVTGHAWAPFISPMGEPFRAHTQTEDTLAAWFRKADRNGDGVLTQDEMLADADRFFATLDTDHNGQIDPDELARYEYDIAPDVQVNSRKRPGPGDPPPKPNRTREADHGDRQRREQARRDEDELGLGGKLQGAARYGLLNLPEPVAAADADFDRAITLQEFREAAVLRFDLLDTHHTGRITLDQLEAIRSAALASDRRVKRDSDAPDARLGSPVPHEN
ncbi:MAG: EF-hand domain-containing protein [Sphingomicrobium sp.]